MAKYARIRSEATIRRIENVPTLGVIKRQAAAAPSFKKSKWPLPTSVVPLTRDLGTFIKRQRVEKRRLRNKFPLASKRVINRIADDRVAARVIRRKRL